MKTLKERLSECSTAGQIEQVFSKAPLKKKALLLEAMEAEELGSIPPKLTPEQEYSAEVAIFVDGTWRLLILVDFSKHLWYA